MEIQEVLVRQDYRIIVEGMDGGGKTTLIERLQEKFHNLEYIRNPKGPDQDFDVWWPEQLDRGKSPIVPIHDRFFYSEIVYGPTLRGHITANDNLVQNSLWFLRSHAFLIYARPHSDTLREGFKNRKQMEGVEEQFTKLLEAYDTLMALEASWYKDRFLRYDWVNPGSFHEVENTVERYMLGELE